MDPVKNPYTPNAGSRPPELAGRDEQLEQFRVLVARLKDGQTEQSIIAKGLRGVGKTVLLNAFEDMAESEGFLTYYHELTDESSLVEELARDSERALAMLKLSEKLTRKVRDGLGHLKTIKLTGPEGIGLEVDLRRASEGTLTADLTDLFLELGAAARERGRGVIFFLDEVQFANEAHYRALISALHRSNQKQLPISAAAAGLPQIPRLTGDARSYAERLFDFPTIANLDRDAATAALVEPARAQGVDYADDALELALEWTEGYPFYIQQVGKHAWNQAEKTPITRADVEAALPAAQAALDRTIYEVRIQRATANERKYMRAMAELGEGPYRSGSVARKLGQASTALSQVRQRLMNKGLIYATEDYGFIDFSVPRFAEYMRRHLPYQPPARKRRRSTGG
ncbi:MAG: ATP-binding protein [Solirubrobacterales bacterium]